MKTGLILLLLLFVTVLVVQNTEVVTLRFLFWEVALSRVVLLLLTFVVGGILGFAVAKLKSGPRQSE